VTIAEDVQVPLSIRLHLGRAAVQTIADRASIDLLHIKGDAVDPRLRPILRPGTDIDILVRPSHLARLDRELRAFGWQVYSTFENGSPFGHAQTYRHETWGFVDVHRLFPGIGLDPASAFARLWSERESMLFGGVSCPVPTVAAQAAILVLNAARMRGTHPRDLGPTWSDASPTDREELLAQIEALDARLAFDAAFGRLDDHRGASEYRLWKAVSQGGGRVEEWWGRVLAARGLAARIRVIGRVPLVNVEHLEHELGRPPTRLEVVREFFARPLRGLRELRRRSLRARRVR
jgi:hypothetical protein